ncbi:TetR/AcrR family transcriptional regulator [Phreatobacter stygius]|uniref:TetR/AcrR family transcriptional regulator n=1 Tax=Phreatobacter stygius TaxID=1940610 RepID=A0A4D7BJW6_9HYPH|nr:TetR/AcrR family transcriptional regulator [Phreatobacter stygius]QCI68017.1 TetR/AcrR family transcriptional regulator [Phreatobacter stygius]
MVSIDDSERPAARRARPVAARRGGKAKETAGSRERILDVAASLFRRRGYKSTTVRDIAEDVGILSGSLFYHFRSKEEILLEIMRAASILNCREAARIVGRPADPMTQLRELIELEITFTIGERNRDFQTVLYDEWREVPETAKPEFLAFRRTYRDFWRQVLNACHAGGRLRCDPHAAELIIHASIIGMIRWYEPAGPFGLDEFGGILASLVAAD